ncbi:hypothetical protein MYCOZU1_02866 [Mycobacterium intracellulare subsp. chimaera]|nr:hypothetical protein MYCODSM44623_02753 [Mycobacterium intracellulare subsp. chimaera]ASL21281.1 hypothetical protein MYCOZU1_02866 [Mycobacterium intracellulare subsp. chimaera]
MKFDCGDELHTIAASQLIIVGERDPFVSKAIAEETVARIPQASLKVYPRRGHVGIFFGRRFADDATRFLSPG